MGLGAALTTFLTTSLTVLGFTKGFRSKDVNVHEFTWSYMERKSEQIDESEDDADVIVFLHGFSAFKESWLWIAGGMNRKYRVLLPDLPGHGRTTPATAHLSYSVELQAQRLHAFLDATVPHDKRVHLVGCSMGGMIAGVYAATYPDRVRSLTLMCPAGVTMPHKSDGQRILESTSRNLLLAHTANDINEMHQLITYGASELPHWFAALIGKSRVRCDCLCVDSAIHAMRLTATSFCVSLDPVACVLQAERLDVYAKIVRDCFAEPTVLDAYLPHIRAKTLAIWGKHDRVLDASCLSTSEAAMADNSLRVLVFDKCGHTVHHEKHLECTAAINAFLDDLAQ